MRNYDEPGEVLPFTAPVGGVVSGGLYLIGNVLVVATVDAAAGEKFSAYIGPGVVTGPKDGSVLAEGVRVHWDDTAKKFTTTATANQLVGIAAAARLTGDTTAPVRLDGVARL